MTHTLEYYASKPNLPAPLPEPEGLTNNEKFNALLNSCQHPRAVYNALAAFAEAGEEAAG